jgi:hypothetical protein
VRTAIRRASLSLLALTAACSASDARPAWQATVDTVGDTIVVRTMAGSVWEEERVLVPEVEIGVIEGEDVYMLGGVRGLAVNEAGDIFALDGQVPIIRRYGPDGRHSADIGGEGGGPGEYRQPDGGLALLPDGRLLIRDPGNARITVYAPDGGYLAGWTLPSGGGFSTSRKLYTDTAGNAYSMVLLERDQDVTKWTYGLARITPQGGHTDTLRAPVWDFEPAVVTARREGSSSSSSVPFSPSIAWTFSPLGYFVAGVSTEYRIDLFRPQGVLRIERAWEPIAVDPAEKAAEEERITTNFRNSYPGWRWNGPQIPDTKPPFRGIAVGDDGRIWVQLSQPGVEIPDDEREDASAAGAGRPGGAPPAPRAPRFREPITYDVFEADGTYLGRVRTPDGFSQFPEPVFRGDYVWAVQRDELDVPQVVRYRVTPVSEAEVAAR